MRERFLNGIDQLGQYGEALRGSRIALYSNSTGMNRYFESTDQLLHHEFDLRLLIAGEGGLRGEYLPKQAFQTQHDPLTGLPVVSVYHYGDKHLTQEDLDLFDILVIDVQDIGARSFNTVPTLKRLMEDCGNRDKAVVVFDRPNPLGGMQMEGLVYMDEFRSDYACSRLPMRHGLTVGELAGYFNSMLPNPVELEVIQMTGWTRDMYYPNTGRSWIPPSLNLPHFTNAILYPGMQIFEGTNLAWGYGTALPYEIIGAPFLDALQLATELNSKNMSGVYFRPVYFRPSAGAFVGQSCQGVQVQVVDPRSYKGLEVALEILDQVRHDAGSDFRFLEARETGTERPLIDLIAGNDWLRQDGMNTREVLHAGREYISQLHEAMEACTLYPDSHE